MKTGSLAESFLWQGMERFGVQAVQFILQIVLARLLLPEAFGVVVILGVFIQISQSFIDSGFSSSLIQKKKVTQNDFVSVFYLNIFSGLILYFLLFFSSPLLAKFYNLGELTVMLRVMSLCLIMFALSNVQNVILLREINFKKIFLINLSSAVIGGIVGIVLALKGFGVWSLVFLQLASGGIRMILLWCGVCWTPAGKFAGDSLKEMFHFGSKVFYSGLLDTIFNNFYSILIGRFFSPTILGYYSRGTNLPQFLTTGVNGTISKVLFPVLAKYQHDPEKQYEIFKKVLLNCYFFLTPLLIGLIAAAPAIIEVLLGKNWQPCIPYVRWLSVFFLFWPLFTMNLQVLLAVGHSGRMFKLEVIKKTLTVISFFIGLIWGIWGLIVAQVICGSVCIAINGWYTREIIFYSWQRQLLDLLPNFGVGLLMGGVVWATGLISVAAWQLLIIQVLVGVTTYFLFNFLFKNQQLKDMISLGYNFLSKRGEYGI